MLRDFFLGFVKIHILHHATQEEVYGAALIEELRRHGYDLSPGTLYPILHSMEEAGYLSRQERAVQGKVRKYYRATLDGHAMLQETRGKIAELVDEVLEGHGPASLPDPADGESDMAGTVSPNTLASQQESGEAPIIVDVRSESEYASGHVPGAVNIPGDELPAALEDLPQDVPIVAYCNHHHPGSARSERAAGFLRDHGRLAQVLDGGFPGWRDAGFAVEGGSSDSLAHQGNTEPG